MPRYASDTSVPVERTRAEIEALLGRYKATATAVFNSAAEAAICFEIAGRRILFRLALPVVKEFARSKRGLRSPAAARNACDKACRQKWRALLLAIKAKLVSVEEGIETIEQAFMAHIVMPDGLTVGEHVTPRIATAYKEQRMLPLFRPALPAPDSGAAP